MPRQATSPEAAGLLSHDLNPTLNPDRLALTGEEVDRRGQAGGELRRQGLAALGEQDLVLEHGRVQVQLAAEAYEREAHRLPLAQLQVRLVAEDPAVDAVVGRRRLQAVTRDSVSAGSRI